MEPEPEPSEGVAFNLVMAIYRQLLRQGVLGDLDRNGLDLTSHAVAIGYIEACALEMEADDLRARLSDAGNEGAR